MEMNHKEDGNVEVGDGDEGGSGGSPLPTPAQLDAEMQSAQAAAAQMEEEEHEAHPGALQCSPSQILCCLVPAERISLTASIAS